MLVGEGFGQVGIVCVHTNRKSGWIDFKPISLNSKTQGDLKYYQIEPIGPIFLGALTQDHLG